jgi:hypothetical protein
VRARWPEDAVDVTVDGEKRWAPAADVDALHADPPAVTGLLGPVDLYLQARDRPLLVADRAHAKGLWPALGRPGGVVVDGEVIGTWRARRNVVKVALTVGLWMDPTDAARRAIDEQAERLAEFRRCRLAGVEVTGGA